MAMIFVFVNVARGAIAMFSHKHPTQIAIRACNMEITH